MTDIAHSCITHTHTHVPTNSAHALSETFFFSWNAQVMWINRSIDRTYLLLNNSSLIWDFPVAHEYTNNCDSPYHYIDQPLFNNVGLLTFL